MDTFADLVTAGVTERTANGWNRKTLAAADLASMAPDDTNNRMDIDIPDQTWDGCVDGMRSRIWSSATRPRPARTNAQLVPLTLHDFAVTPSGGDVARRLRRPFLPGLVMTPVLLQCRGCLHG